MAMKLSTLAEILGDLGNEILHAILEGGDQRFMALFEDKDNDGIYELKKDRLQLADKMGFDIPKMCRRLLKSFYADEVEFELETPLHLTGDAKTSDDIEVSLKSGGLFKSHSFLKIKVKMKSAEPPEGLMTLIDKVNAELKHDFGSERPEKETT